MESCGNGVSRVGCIFLFFYFFDDDKLLCKGLSLRSQPTRSLFERIVSDKRKVGRGSG